MKGSRGAYGSGQSRALCGGPPSREATEDKARKEEGRKRIRSALEIIGPLFWRRVSVLDLSGPTLLNGLDNSGVVVMVLGLQGEKEGYSRG